MLLQEAVHTVGTSHPLATTAARWLWLTAAGVDFVWIGEVNLGVGPEES